MGEAKQLKDLTALDLNPSALKRRRTWAIAMLEAANLINETYSTSTIHLWAIGDCLLAKLNLLNRKVRRNPGMKTAIESAANQKRQAENLRKVRSRVR